jgi:hypothetical protein
VRSVNSPLSCSPFLHSRTSPQESNNLTVFPNVYCALLRRWSNNLCLDCACDSRRGARANDARTERTFMQNGSVIRAKRQRGPDVWEFRWREPGADGKRKHRRMILGSTEQLADETTARQAIATLRLDLNHGEAWLKTRSTAVSELCGSLSGARVGTRYDLENTFDQSHVRGLSKQVDTTPLGKISTCPRQCWGG